MANGFEIGSLPDSLQAATFVEKRLSSIAAMAVPMTVLRGGKRRVLKKHVYVFTRDTTTVSLRLPEILSSHMEECLVVIAGSATTEQEMQGLKRYSCSTETIDKLLKLYTEIYCVYKAFGITVDTNALHQLRCEGPSCILEVTRENDEESLSRLDGEVQSIPRQNHFGEARTASDELQYNETASVLS